MKTQNAKTITARSFLVAAATLGMLLFISITPSFGQKEQAERATTRDGLSATGFMTYPEVSDDLDGNDDEYFYKFQAKPGKLTLTLEVTANETNAGATLDLFGINNKAILSNMLVQAADGGTERASKSVNISKKQDVIIRIKGLRYGSSAGYPGVYKILLEGAVSFNVAVPSDVPVQANTPPTSDPTVPSNMPTTSDVTVLSNPPAASDTTVPSNAPAASPDAAVQNKKPNKADLVIDKAKSKSEKLLRVLDIVTEKKPN